MSKKKRKGPNIRLSNCKKKGNPDRIIWIETVEEAVARGVKIEVLPPQRHDDVLRKVNPAITEAKRRLHQE